MIPSVCLVLRTRVLPRLRYPLATGWRVLTAPWRQRTIDLDIATTIFGCSFGAAGWNHLVEFLREYDARSGLRWDDSILHRYHKNFHPASVCDLLNLPLADACEIPLFTYPWGTFVLNQTDKDRQVGRSRFCGPSTDEFIEAEHHRTIRLYQQIRHNGYTPWRYGCTFISGTFLVDRAGETRFIVMGGNHRLAALAALGVRRVTVRTEPRLLLTRVDEREADRWPLVLGGHCPRPVALAIFRLYFEQNGEHVRRLVMRTPSSSTPSSDL